MIKSLGRKPLIGDLNPGSSINELAVWNSLDYFPASELGLYIVGVGTNVFGSTCYMKADGDSYERYGVEHGQFLGAQQYYAYNGNNYVVTARTGARASADIDPSNKDTDWVVQLSRGAASPVDVFIVQAAGTFGNSHYQFPDLSMSNGYGFIGTGASTLAVRRIENSAMTRLDSNVSYDILRGSTGVQVVDFSSTLDSSGNPFQETASGISVSQTGRYLLSYHYSMNFSGSTVIDFYIAKNGVELQGSKSWVSNHSVGADLIETVSMTVHSYLSNGDALDVRVHYSSGDVDTVMSIPGSNNFTAVWLGQ